MKIVIYVSDSSDPRFNLAAEEIMFDRTVPGQVTLFLWQNERTVIIGKSQNAWNEARVEKLRSDGGVLVRRPSGGGAVYHDLGNMCYTFVCSPELYSLPRQLKVILNAVKACGIDAEFTGRNDIVTPDGRKFSGNAFRFSGSAALMHGTLLIHTDFSRMSEYLSVPKAKIEAKGVSSVRSRVANLSEINPEITVERVKTDMIRAFLDEYQPGNVGPDGSRNTTAADAFPVLSVCEKELLSGSGNVFFSELPEKYRTVIHLYYFEDIPIEKIARICGLPKATVGTRLSRGRGLLKEKLGGEFGA